MPENLQTQSQAAARTRPKRRDERIECNEEIMLDAMTEKGCVELRVAFQIYWPQRQQWVGLKGRSFRAVCKNPGVALQVVRVVENAVFTPGSYPPPAAN